MRHVNIYPNPANTEITIEIKENFYDEIVIYAASGQAVFVAQPGVDQYNIDISHLVDGMYFVRFIANGMAATQRFYQAVKSFLDP